MRAEGAPGQHEGPGGRSQLLNAQVDESGHPVSTAEVAHPRQELFGGRSIRCSQSKALSLILLTLRRPQEIATILLSRGSLAFNQLARLSALPPATIHSSLVILSIHSLLFHSESEVGGRLVELYEMNQVGIERRMRGGWYVEMAREWNPAAGLDAVIESLWKDGMQKRDALESIMARAMWDKQESDDRERAVYERQSKELPTSLKQKGKRMMSAHDGALSFSPSFGETR